MPRKKILEAIFEVSSTLRTDKKLITDFPLENPEIPERFARDIDKSVWQDPNKRYGKYTNWTIKFQYGNLN